MKMYCLTEFTRTMKTDLPSVYTCMIMAENLDISATGL